MSRALEAGVKRALQNGNHKESFERISAVLNSSHEAYLEIEILPRSHVHEADSYVLRDGEYIGIPKLRLVQAFLHARQMLNDVLLSTSRGGTPAHDGDVMRATAVMLLMDSEHLTAANMRKRALGSGGSLDQARRKDLLVREAFLMNSLLRSRLHRHTKSPVLWNHKRWLLRQLRDCETPIRLRHEFEQVICVAAERHARNYYAWTYARDVIAMEVASASSATSPARRASFAADSLLPVVTRWCRLHHQDISGWSFLLHLVGLFPEKAEGVAQETLLLVEKFEWRNESVWHFLKNLALMPVLQSKKACIEEVWRKLKLTADGGESIDAIILDRAAAWWGFS
ncbi:hypothetical protein E4U42_004602 [Claviceps africana]|uniref:Protein prenyltransferase n=1 Tax=Claviceps africana TaxID=83212 RepID=A0A8K0J522_9HYPO|nr:hypothetical protein E4U42_004602 [Claviceps africana]